MGKIIRVLDKKSEEVAGVIILGSVIFLIFIGVFMRLVFKIGIPLQEELSRMLYVILIHLGASYGIRDNDHIRITFVYNKFPEKGRVIMRIITDAIWAGYQIMIIILSIRVFRDMAEFPGYTGVMKLPLHWVFAIIPISFTLITFRLIQKFIIDYRSGDLSIRTE